MNTNHIIWQIIVVKGDHQRLNSVRNHIFSIRSQRYFRHKPLFIISFKVFVRKCWVSGHYIYRKRYKYMILWLAEMWYHVFLWSLFSSIIIHVFASSIAFGSLRRHKIARYAPLLIIVSGIITPLTAYSITSAAVAGVHRAASFQMYPLYAMFWGCGQTLVTVVFSFSRVLATLWNIVSFVYLNYLIIS